MTTRAKSPEPLPKEVLRILGRFHVEQKPGQARLEIIMCEKWGGNKGKFSTEFVVWYRNANNGACFEGSYHEERADARREFVRRILREEP